MHARQFEDFLDFSRKAGYRPELAWTCCDYADTLLQRNQSRNLMWESLSQVISQFLRVVE